MQDSMNRFLELSIALTGYNRAELGATGLAETYLSTVLATVGEAPLGDLLSAWESIENDSADDPSLQHRLITERILSVPALGPIAKNLIVLWYLGQWQQMPYEWRQANGASAQDQTHVVSAATYREGLVWSTIGAHPMGAKQQGYGAWSLPPAPPSRPSGGEES